jgi:5-hydroxyisourate hydrolase-like protein (transthyretin family)
MLAIFALVAASVFGIGLGALQLKAASGRAEPAAPTPTVVKPARDGQNTVSGRVLSPAGKPLAGAKLTLVGGNKKVEELGVSGADGKFTVAAPRGKRWAILLARAPGVGPALVDLGRLPPGDVELHTVEDHPIRGRVLDTQGKPVAGVKVAVHQLGDYGKTAEPLLTQWKKRSPHDGLPGGVAHLWDEDGLFAPVTTGQDGKFTFTGMGAERLVGLRLSGGAVANAEAYVVNRAGFDPKPYNKAAADNAARIPFGFGVQWLLYGPDLSVVAEAEKPIRGVVKDVDTGKPRAGVKVTLSRNGDDLVSNIVSATTDANGRYEIRGANKSPKGYMVEVSSDPATGHMRSQARAADTPGYTPITIDVPVKKGVVITGKVIDRATGKALPGFAQASVLPDNAFARGYPTFNSSAWFASGDTGADGTFRIVTLPGAVILMGGVDPRRLPDGEMGWYRYKAPVPDPKYPQYFRKQKGYEGTFYGYGGGISPIQGSFCKVLILDPAATEVKHDVVLERASALAVKIVDATGGPLKNTWVAGVSPQDWHRPVRVATDACEAYQVHPGKPRLLVFHSETGKLFGILRLKGDETTPVVAKLGPGGSAKGRLLDEAGRPIAGAAVRLYFRERAAEEVHAHVHRARLVETAADGTFRIDDLVTGVKFALAFARGRRSFDLAAKVDAATEPGKTLDLGDVKVKQEPATKGE